MFLLNRGFGISHFYNSNKFVRYAPMLVLVTFILLFASIGAYLVFSSSAASSLNADFNSDSTVNVYDLSILATNWGKTSVTHAQGDANNDSTINIYDLSIVASEWGQTITITPTPIPTGQPANSVNVKDYGVKGDGVTDDTAKLLVAFNAAVTQNKIAWVPSGTYMVSSLTLPSGLTIKGQDMTSSWLKGRLNFGSNQYISDLKIGSEGNSAVHNTNGANNTTFERVHFRGGGGSNYTSRAIIALGMDGNASNITFKSCEVERNLGSSPDFVLEFNNITIYEQAGAHVSDITFDNCHVGVSNGVKTGSPRMALEAWVNPNASVGWKNITIRNSIFEATDAQNLDFSDQDNAIANGVLVEDSTIKGGGVTNVKWGYSICIEAPTGVVIRNNTIYHGSEQTIMFANLHPTGPGAIITGNNFDLMFTNGVPASTSYPFSIWGQYNSFTGNTITYSSDYVSRVVELVNASHNVVTGNTFYIDNETAVWENFGNSSNTISPNTVF